MSQIVCFGIFWNNKNKSIRLCFVARLDGTNKPMKHATIEEYLQMDGWEPPPSSSNGKKRVSSSRCSSNGSIEFH